ncbi:InlB B-repeat-containing protein [bacterium]|nr:InlB B-repeat-containing protein [bacterium]
MDAITQDYNTAVIAPANPEKTGYTFTGWNTEIPTTMPAEDLTITAQWVPNSNTQYKVIYYKEMLDGSYAVKETGDFV